MDTILAVHAVVIGGVVFLVVLLILWFLLPFAVFGIKGRLDQLITEARNTNQVMQQLSKEVTALRSAMAGRPLPAPAESKR